MTGYPFFVDDETIAFFTYANPDEAGPAGSLRVFTVHTDGKDLEALPSPLTDLGSRVVPAFRVIGGRTSLLDLYLGGEPEELIPSYEPVIREVFVSQGKQLLQLTTFTRPDTSSQFLDRRKRRIVFRASADPLGENPTNNCQLFSITTLGDGLRQLTHFHQGEERSTGGCSSYPPPGCRVGRSTQDPLTGTVVFYSSCDPFGTNPFGSQIFTMRPDGSGLRQLTAARGLARLADGSITVELPGPIAYSGSANSGVSGE